jgi:nicotinate-nucleotide pyrophosphorylase (carboxylating)
VAGLPAAETAVGLVDSALRWTVQRADGRAVAAGDRVARLDGPARGILAAERLLLNLLARLSGLPA